MIGADRSGDLCQPVPLLLAGLAFSATDSNQTHPPEPTSALRKISRGLRIER